MKNEILLAIESHSVVVISGDTGCGECKSDTFVVIHGHIRIAQVLRVRAHVYRCMP